MDAHLPIIDVTPTSYSSERLSGHPVSSEQTTSPPQTRMKRIAAGSAIGSLLQIAAGSGLVLLGIPMLVLPGPGLLSIIGGVALVRNGIRKIAA